MNPAHGSETRDGSCTMADSTAVPVASQPPSLPRASAKALHPTEAPPAPAALSTTSDDSSITNLSVSRHSGRTTYYDEDESTYYHEDDVNSHANSANSGNSNHSFTNECINEGTNEDTNEVSHSTYNGLGSSHCESRHSRSQNSFESSLDTPPYSKEDGESETDRTTESTSVQSPSNSQRSPNLSERSSKHENSTNISSDETASELRNSAGSPSEASTLNSPLANSSATRAVADPNAMPSLMHEALTEVNLMRSASVSHSEGIASRSFSVSDSASSSSYTWASSSKSSSSKVSSTKSSLTETSFQFHVDPSRRKQPTPTPSSRVHLQPCQQQRGQEKPLYQHRLPRDPCLIPAKGPSQQLPQQPQSQRQQQQTNVQPKPSSLLKEVIGQQHDSVRGSVISHVSEPSMSSSHNDRYFQSGPSNLDANDLEEVDLSHQSNTGSSALEYSPSSSHRHPPSMRVDHKQIVGQAYFNTAPSSNDEGDGVFLDNVDYYSNVDEASGSSLSVVEFVSKKLASKVFCRPSIPITLDVPKAPDDDISNLDDRSARRSHRRHAKQQKQQGRDLSLSHSSLSAESEESAQRQHGKKPHINVGLWGKPAQNVMRVSVEESDRHARANDLRLQYVDYLSKIDLASNSNDLSTVEEGWRKETAAPAFVEQKPPKQRPHTLDVPMASDDVRPQKSTQADRALSKDRVEVLPQIRDDSFSTMGSVSDSSVRVEDVDSQHEADTSVVSTGAVKPPKSLKQKSRSRKRMTEEDLQANIDIIRSLLRQSHETERRRRIGRMPGDPDTKSPLRNTTKKSEEMRKRAAMARLKLQEKIQEVSTRRHPRTIDHVIADDAIAQSDSTKAKQSSQRRPRSKGPKVDTHDKDRDRESPEEVKYRGDRRRFKRVNLELDDERKNGSGQQASAETIDPNLKLKQVDYLTTLSVARHNNNISPVQAHMSKDIARDAFVNDSAQSKLDREDEKQLLRRQTNDLDDAQRSSNNYSRSHDDYNDEMQAIDLEDPDPDRKDSHGMNRLDLIKDGFKELSRRRCCGEFSCIRTTARRIWNSTKRASSACAASTKRECERVQLYCEPCLTRMKERTEPCLSRTRERMEPCMAQTRERIGPCYGSTQQWFQRSWETHMAGRPKVEIIILVLIAVSVVALFIIFIAFLAQGGS